MTTYSVNEVFKRLKALKITSNEESVRRWLRTGKLKGYQNSKKHGWQNNGRGSSTIYQRKNAKF